MDVNGVEQVNVAALGGADTITVNDLSGTGVTDVNLDLAGTLGGSTGDRQADTVIVNGTVGNDSIAVAGTAGNADVLGLAARVHEIGRASCRESVQVSGVAVSLKNKAC